MVKIGLFGAGHLGKVHLELLKKIGELELVGFYDINPERAKEVEQMLGVQAFPSAEALLEKVDAVDIVTPTITHFDVAADAILRGKHCFIEKPYTATREEANRLAELAKKSDVKVQIGYVERYNPAYIAAVPFIEEPLYVESFRESSFHTRSATVPVVLDMMIHDIDIVLDIVNSSVKHIAAWGASALSSSIDTAKARLEFENGTVAELTVNRVATEKFRRTRVFQRDNHITIDFLRKTAAICRFQNGEQVEEQISCEDSNAIMEELKSFGASIREDKEPPVPLRDGLNSMEIAFRIMEEMNR